MTRHCNFSLFDLDPRARSISYPGRDSTRAAVAWQKGTRRKGLRAGCHRLVRREPANFISPAAESPEYTPDRLSGRALNQSNALSSGRWSGVRRSR